MSSIKAILFDMDGVLIDAKEWHFEALNKALQLFGMEINRYDHLVTYDGLPTTKKLEMLSIERGLPKDLHQFISDMKQQYTMEIIHAKCKPTFYHEYALSKLKEEGYRMAVCSNSVRSTVEIMMQKAAITPYFDFFISNQDVKCCKPDPEMYIKAIEIMSLAPKECMILEDNENGIKAAKASGANVMIVNSVEDMTYENIKEHLALFEGAYYA